MGRRTQGDHRFEELKKKIPDGAFSVKVLDAATGKSRFKPTETLTEFDNIQVGKDGVPIVMMKSPGKIKKVTIEPATPMAAEIIRRKTAVLSSDVVTDMSRQNPDDPDILKFIMIEISEEAASIGFERSQAELRGEKTSELSMRKISALKSVGDIWLRRREQIMSRGVDMASPAYKVLMKEIIKAFQETLTKSGFKNEQIETIFVKLSKIMDEKWEAETRRKIENPV